MNNETERKQRARETIEALAALDASKRPGGGVHGQVIGMEPYVIRTTGEDLQCLYEAQYLLDKLLDPFDRRAAPQVAAPACDMEELRATLELRTKEYEQANSDRLELAARLSERPMPATLTPAMEEAAKRWTDFPQSMWIDIVQAVGRVEAMGAAERAAGEAT